MAARLEVALNDAGTAGNALAEGQPADPGGGWRGAVVEFVRDVITLLHDDFEVAAVTGFGADIALYNAPGPCRRLRNHLAAVPSQGRLTVRCQ